jgi:hypothetical protein
METGWRSKMGSRRVQILVGLALAALVTGGVVLGKSRRPAKERHFVSRDIRLHFPKPKSTVGWTQNKQYTKDEESIVLKLRLKKPDSSDPFDFVMTIQGFDQKGSVNFRNPETGEETQISAGSIQRMAEHMMTGIRKSYKDIKDEQKLRKKRISRTVKKGYVYMITGLRDFGASSMPVHTRLYAFGFDGKTYLMSVMMTTTTLKNEKLLESIDDMIKGLVAWKP